MWWPFLFEFVAAYWQQSRLLRQQSWIRIQHFLVAVRGSRVDQYCISLRIKGAWYSLGHVCFCQVEKGHETLECGGHNGAAARQPHLPRDVRVVLQSEVALHKRNAAR